MTHMHIYILFLILISCIGSLAGAQDQKIDAKAKEQARAAIKKFHEVILGDDGMAKLKILKSYSPTEKEMIYLFGKKHGAELYKRNEALLEKAKKSLAQQREMPRLEIEKIKIDPIARDSKTFPYMKTIPKDVFVFEFTIFFKEGGGGGGGNFFVHNKRVCFLREMNFRNEYKDVLKGQSK